MHPTWGTAATVTQMVGGDLTQGTLPPRQAVTCEMISHVLAVTAILARVRTALIDTYFTIPP